MATVAFLFPGQGAQCVGMGKDFVERFSAARRRFEEASDILGWDVARLCFEGPKTDLDRTAACQPAILTTSLAIVDAMREAGASAPDRAAAAAGLSLGEYSALVMAGAMSFADAVRLVERRARFMDEACQANPGTMASVLGLEDEAVEAICAQVRETDMVVAANFNCPGQVVISGTRAGVEKASVLARQRGASRVVPLAVSGAFHSPLMAPAARRLAPLLVEVPMGACRMPVISNVDAAPVTEPDAVRAALARQVESPVRWRQSMERLISDGVREFVEVGPGSVLRGLLRRIDPSVVCHNVATVASLREWLGG